MHTSPRSTREIHPTAALTKKKKNIPGIHSNWNSHPQTDREPSSTTRGLLLLIWHGSHNLPSCLTTLPPTLHPRKATRRFRPSQLWQNVASSSIATEWRQKLWGRRPKVPQLRGSRQRLDSAVVKRFKCSTKRCEITSVASPPRYHPVLARSQHRRVAAKLLRTTTTTCLFRTHLEAVGPTCPMGHTHRKSAAPNERMPLKLSASVATPTARPTNQSRWLANLSVRQVAIRSRGNAEDQGESIRLLVLLVCDTLPGRLVLLHFPPTPTLAKQGLTHRCSPNHEALLQGWTV